MAKAVYTKVFLTWSGTRSRAVAKALKGWLQDVIQVLEPWMSEDDIDKGAKWASEVSNQLEQTRFGIVCLTPENLNEPWINFEAGALSKLPDSYVCTFLFDLQHSDVEYPLAQFQHTNAEEADIKLLLQTINKKLGEQTLKDQQLDKAFEKWWPNLKEALGKIPPASSKEKRPKRTNEELLGEILELCREQDKKSNVVLQRLAESSQSGFAGKGGEMYSRLIEVPTGASLLDSENAFAKLFRQGVIHVSPPPATTTVTAPPKDKKKDDKK